LFVTDYRQKAVFVVNKATLKILRSFPIEGAPLAVAWHRGRVYVGNETTGRVEVYNPAGKHLSDLGGPGKALMRPSDVAIDERSGTVMVVDSSDGTVKVFDLNGVLLQTISSPALVNPTGIVLDPERREVIVSDYGDPALKYPARVLVFDHAGNLLRNFSGRTGGFSRPQGMANDHEHVFLAEALAGKVLVLDRMTGAVVKTLGTFGSGRGELMLPLDVLLDPLTRDVYVTNNRMGRIERFPEGGMLP
jgi:DNA-binding beta-propeller fold protein YncE